MSKTENLSGVKLDFIRRFCDVAAMYNDTVYHRMKPDIESMLRIDQEVA